MLDNNDLKAIAELMNGLEVRLDTKIDKRFQDFEDRMDAKMDKRFQDFEDRMDAKMDKRFQDFEDRMDAKMDKRFQEFEDRMDAKMDKRFQDFEGRTDEKMDKRLEDFEACVHNDAMVLIETEFRRQFNLLAEGQQNIREMLIDPERVDALEASDSYNNRRITRLDQEVDELRKDVQELKKAN